MARATPATNDGANRQRHRDANGIASMNRKARRSGAKAGHAPAPQAVHQLVGLCRAQQFSQAAPLARDFTRKWPGHPVGWNALAMCMQAMGRPDEAIHAYRKALEIEPDNADGHNNLGLLLMETGAPAEAVKSYRRAIRIRPGFKLAHYNMGLALAELGRLEEAEQHQRRAIETDPEFIEAHNQLGNVLQQLKRPADAEQCYRQALALQPNYAEVYTNLGNVLAEQDKRVEAEACHRQAIALRPEFAEAYANLGNLLRDAGRVVESEEALGRALALRPDDSGMQWNRAATLMQVGREHEALELYRRVVEQRPDLAEAHEDLGNALADIGELDEAMSAYREALSLDSRSARARFHMSLIRKFEENDPERDALERELERDDLTPRERVHLEFAAGKAWADIGDFDRAFAHYSAGARIKRSLIDYEVDRDIEWFELIASVSTSELLDSFAGAGHPSDAPVFIVGMPRSGTSLVEQILASHPEVHGAGERPDLRALIELKSRQDGRVYPEWMTDLSREECERLGREYCRAVVDPVSGHRRVTDKMPANFSCLGFVRAALPGARVIHVHREPADTCLSCFTYLFAGSQAFTYDLEELGRYYRAYDALMAHWRQVLPADFLFEVRYEDLVDNPGEWIARMLDHCGLEWDDACLHFHRSDRAVRTASAQQVRKPLYRGAVGRWKHYREHLGPLFTALGTLAPRAARRDAQ